MKTRILLTIAFLGAALLACAVVLLNQSTIESKPDPGLALSQSAPVDSGSTVPAQAIEARPHDITAAPVSEPPGAAATTVTPPDAPSQSSSQGKLSSPLFKQAVDCLTSTQTAHPQRQEALKRLREAGKLDAAIQEIERQAETNSVTAQHPAALGQLYLEKCATIQDTREQGILAMKADQAFDAALNLDPENWEARFTKAVALSYWPAEMNKGDEIVEHFVTLMKQQEKQSPQPHFADTYFWLGNQYQKLGRPDYAREVWQRGAALYPDNRELQTRLQP
jgi:hypothetical protein